MLTDIKRYLQEHQQASLRDLAVHFDIDPRAMRDMMAQWMRKGTVVKTDDSTCCAHGCCMGCDKSAMEIYQLTYKAPN
jgi:predicted ArsR family transcriptional regulator